MGRNPGHLGFALIGKSQHDARRYPVAHHSSSLLIQIKCSNIQHLWQLRGSGYSWRPSEIVDKIFRLFSGGAGRELNLATDCHRNKTVHRQREKKENLEFWVDSQDTRNHPITGTCLMSKDRKNCLTVTSQKQHRGLNNCWLKRLWYWGVSQHSKSNQNQIFFGMLQSPKSTIKRISLCFWVSFLSL